MALYPSPERLARDLDWNLLRTFLILAESNSVTDAAERLSLTQPAVSIALSNFEADLGFRLFTVLFCFLSFFNAKI